MNERARNWAEIERSAPR